MGYHPRLYSCHHYVVLYGIIDVRGLRFAPPTAVFFSPLRGSKRLLCNHYELCIMNYALKEAHGCVLVTATWF